MGQQLTVSISVVPVAKRFLALTRLGGITVRGKSADTASDALRNLFYVLASTTEDDAVLGVELLAAEQDLTPELTEGKANA